MPFYDNVLNIESKSSIDQRSDIGNCYKMAPLAAAALVEFKPRYAEDQEYFNTHIDGAGGNGDRAFKRIGFPISVTFGASRRGLWKSIIGSALINRWPVAVLINWSHNPNSGLKNPKRDQGHLVYLIGYEIDIAYCRDQQNSHVLIPILMKTWSNGGYRVVEGKPLRNLQVTALSVGLQDEDERIAFIRWLDKMELINLRDRMERKKKARDSGHEEKAASAQ